MPDLYRPAFVHGYDIEITQGQDWLIGFRLLARKLTGDLYLADTTGCTARMTVRAPDQTGAAQLDVTTTSGEIVAGYSPALAARSTAYVLGQQMTAGGAVYQCTTAGTTASGAVAYDDVPNHTTADGTVVWTCIGTDGSACNLTVVLPAAMTAGLTPWGRGVYSLEVFDTYAHSIFYCDGAAYLRPESTY